MKILIADDEPRVRSALRLVLEHQPHTQVAGEAGSGAGLLATLITACPDLVLVDWELPGLPTPGLVQSIRNLCPTVLIVAMSSRPESYRAALAAGADAFVSKGDPPDRLLATLRILAHAPRSGDPGTTLPIAPR